MGDWEDDIIEELATGETRAIEGDNLRQTADYVMMAYKQVREAINSAIDRISKRANAIVEHNEDIPSGRIRWTYGDRLLSLRIERSTSRLFVSVDLGNNLLLDHITVTEHECTDQQGRDVTGGELAERFVPLLFGAKIDAQ